MKNKIIIFIKSPIFILIRLVLAIIIVSSGLGCTILIKSLVPFLLSLAIIIMMFPDDIFKLYNILKRFLPKLYSLIRVRKD